MSANSEFFGQRGDQAVLKHGVLARYAHYFAGRAGAATKGQVAFIDGYAGEGRYEDGSPGSPLLLASQATRAELFGRHVKLALVEQDAARRGRLKQSLSEAEVVPDQILGGSFEAEIHGLLDRYAGHAVLLFVDPFGLGISRPTLQQILGRRSRSTADRCALPLQSLDGGEDGTRGGRGGSLDRAERAAPRLRTRIQ